MGIQEKDLKVPKEARSSRDKIGEASSSGKQTSPVTDPSPKKKQKLAPKEEPSQAQKKKVAPEKLKAKTYRKGTRQTRVSYLGKTSKSTASELVEISDTERTVSEAESSSSEEVSISRTSSLEVSHPSSAKKGDSSDDIPIAQLKKKRKKPEKVSEQVGKPVAEKAKDKADVDLEAFIEEMEEIRDDAALTSKKARKEIASTDRLLKAGPAYDPNEGTVGTWLTAAAAIALTLKKKKDPFVLSETEVMAIREIEAQVSAIPRPEKEASVDQTEGPSVAADEEASVAHEEPPLLPAAAAAEVTTSAPTSIPIIPAIQPTIPISPLAPILDSTPAVTELLHLATTHASSRVVSPVASPSPPSPTHLPSPPSPSPLHTESLPSPPTSPVHTLTVSLPTSLTPPPITLSSSVINPSPILLADLPTPTTTSHPSTSTLPFPDLSSLFIPSPFISTKPRKKTLASKSKAPSTSTPTTRPSTSTTMRQSLDYLINRHTVFEQEVHQQLTTLRQQHQDSHSQLLAAIQNLQNHIPSQTFPVTSSTNTISPVHSSFPEPLSIPTSPPSSPIILSDTSSPHTPPTSVISTPPTSVIQTPLTSVIPPTPPTSLVSPISSSSTAIHPPIPFCLPLPYASITQQQENIARSPFIGIIPGVSPDIYLAPQPLRAQFPTPTPSPDLLLTLPSLPSITAPSPSHVPIPHSLTFTLRQLTTPPSSSGPIFSIFPTTTTPSSTDHAS